MSDREALLAEAKRIKRERLLAEAKAVQARSQAAAAEVEAEKPSQAEAGTRGAAQGLSFGLADEAYGVVGAIVNPTNSDKDFGDRYRDSRDFARRGDKKAQVAHPGTYKATEVGGGVATAFVPGLGALNAAKGAGAAQVVGKAALQGGATGLGLSEADVTKGEIPEALADTATGAALGGATAGALRGIGKKLSPKALKFMAERRAAKAAIGNQGKIYDELQRTGRINKVGRDMLDDGVVKFGSSARGIADGAAKKMDAAWKGMEGAFAEVDKATPNSVRGADIANDILEYAGKIDAPHNEALVDNLLRQAERYERMGEVPLSEAQRLKNLLKFDARDPAAMPMGKEATNAIKRSVGEQMEKGVGRHVDRARLAQASAAKVAAPAAARASQGVRTATGETLSSAVDDPVAAAVDQVGGKLSSEERQALTESMRREFSGATAASPKQSGGEDRVADLLKQYQGFKSKYGNMASVQDAAERLANRQEKNRTFSPTDYLAMMATMAVNPGDGVKAAAKAAAVGVGHKAIRERGSAAAAVTLDKVSKALAAGGQALGPFAPILAKAAKNGHLAATHMVLMKNPTYAELVGAKSKKESEP